jgi:hypothetical protein
MRVVLFFFSFSPEITVLVGVKTIVIAGVRVPTSSSTVFFPILKIAFPECVTYATSRYNFDICSVKLTFT